MENSKETKQATPVGSFPNCPNMVGVTVSYKGATNEDGEHVEITLPRAVHEDAMDAIAPVAIIAYDYEKNSTVDMAAAYIYARTGLHPVGKTQAQAASGGCDLLFYKWYQEGTGRGHGEINAFETILQEVFNMDISGNAAS